MRLWYPVGIVFTILGLIFEYGSHKETGSKRGGSGDAEEAI